MKEIIKSFCLWLSGHTDSAGQEASTEHEIALFCGLGACVLIPCTQAFIASCYALNSTFKIDYIIVIPLSLFFSLCILAVDRFLLTIQIPTHLDKEVYSNFQRFMMSPLVNWIGRLLITIVLGLVLSTAMVLGLFYDPIHSFYVKDIEVQKIEVQKEYQTYLDENKSEFDNLIRDMNDIKSQLLTGGGNPGNKTAITVSSPELNALRNKLDACESEAADELGGKGSSRTGKQGHGPVYREIKKRCERIEGDIRRIESEIINSQEQSRVKEEEQWRRHQETIEEGLKGQLADIDNRLKSNEEQKKRLEKQQEYRLEELEEQKKNFGIIAQWGALQGLIKEEEKKEGSSFTDMAHILVVLLLMLLDLIPITYKFCLPSSGYSQMMEQRERALEIDRYVDKNNLAKRIELDGQMKLNQYLRSCQLKDEEDYLSAFIHTISLHIEELGKLVNAKNHGYEQLIQQAPKEDQSQEFTEDVDQICTKVWKDGREALQRRLSACLVNLAQSRGFTKKDYDSE